MPKHRPHASPACGDVAHVGVSTSTGMGHMLPLLDSSPGVLSSEMQSAAGGMMLVSALIVGRQGSPQAAVARASMEART